MKKKIKVLVLKLFDHTSYKQLFAEVRLSLRLSFKCIELVTNKESYFHDSGQD